MKSIRKTVWLRLLAAFFLVVLGGPVVAERTRFWRQTSYEDFDRGTAKGVALRSDGKLVLAPRFAQFADPNAAYLWSLRLDSKGNLFAAAGSNARVQRFDAACLARPVISSTAAASKDSAASKDDVCKPTTVFEGQELSAQAIVLDTQDNLYVATSPDGKVYRVTPKGEKTTFFDPKTKYIWDLAMDSSGTLFVATGDKGEVYAVKPDGKGEVFFKSEETHARALVFDVKGNLIVGTEPNGLVIRVDRGGDPKTAPVRGFVLYETDKKEVTSLLADRAGNLFVGAVGEKPKTPVNVPGTPQPQQPPNTGAPQPVAQPTQFVPFPITGGGSEVYRIGADGAPETLWTSRDDLVYSLGMSASGKLLLGTGGRGTVIQLEGNKVFSSLAKTASSQVTGLTSAAGGKLFVCTANPGKIFAMGPEDEPEGSFESQTFDAKIFSQWGRLSWWGDNGATQGKVEMFVRSGNTTSPEKSWSPWAGPFTDAKGSLVNVPPARFVQWKAIFHSSAGKAGAPGGYDPTSIAWTSLAYLPKNVAPSVDAIVIQNPGVRVQGFIGGQQPNQSPTAQVRMPSAQGSSNPPPPPRFDTPPQGFVQRGTRSIVWSATDANDDELEYTVWYRGEGEKVWKVLKEKVEQKYFSWDTGMMQDGAYYLKVTASDANSNPPGEGLSGERESDRFEVDNTPPIIEGLHAEAGNPEAHVKFTAHDSFSNISRVEYSLDAGEWKIVFPVGRTTDAPQENYEVALRDLAPGEHTLAVRAFDAFDNSTSGKVTFAAGPKK